MIIQIINLLTFNKEKEKRDILNILATKVSITRDIHGLNVNLIMKIQR